MKRGGREGEVAVVWLPWLPVGGGQVVRGHALGQGDGPVVAAVQLLHDESQVRLEQGRGREAPEQCRRVHQHGHQQQDVGEELGTNHTSVRPPAAGRMGRTGDKSSSHIETQDYTKHFRTKQYQLSK